MQAGHRAGRFGGFALTGLVLTALLGGCAQFGRSGPYAGAVTAAASQPTANPFTLVELTEASAQQVLRSERHEAFADVFGEGRAVGTTIGRGDSVDVAIWEAPPAALFGTVSAPASTGSGIQAARSAGLPEQMVDGTGEIVVPFVGHVMVAGREPREIEREIAERLHGKANHPQVVVRITKNARQNVAVVGDVANAGRFPLTPHGERVLDVLADAGGFKQPVTRIVVQLTRGPRVVTMPLDSVIRDPAQNVRLAPDDVVTALYQPWTFVALGATGNNAEIPFEATGMTLAQALGRAGGLSDQRADIKGVFLFRLEDPAALDPAVAAQAKRTPDGKIPVIYRLDLRDPAGFFVAQGFAIRNRDVLYVSNAPGADLQKFTSVLANVAYSAFGLVNQVK